MYGKTFQAVLLCDDAEGYGQTFASLLSEYGYNVNVCGRDTVILPDMSENDPPDCVIIDDCFDEWEYNDYVKNMQEAYGESLVVVLSSRYYDSLRMDINSTENALYLSKPIDAVSVAASLKELENIKASSSGKVKISVSEHELENLLRRLGFSRRFKGFGYLKECFYAALEQPELLGNVSKKLYPCAAERIGAAASSVEKNIRGAISSAYDDGKNKELLSFANSTRCPTNAAVIKALYDHFAGVK